MLSIFSFLLVLTILIFVHELGHFLAARSVGVKIVTFSIGLPPKLIKKTFKDTEYCLSLLPIGGYVQIWGQDQETADPTDSTNYASKKRWQQAWIIIAGPLFNIILAFVAFSAVYQIGIQQPAYLSSPPILWHIKKNSLAAQAGLQARDKIIAINDKKVITWLQTFQELDHEIKAHPDLRLIIERNKEQKIINFINLSKNKVLGITPLIVPIIGKVIPNTPASHAGLQAGDHIIALNEIPIHSWQSVTNLLQANTNNSVQLTILRNKQTIQAMLTPIRQNKRKIIGISMPLITIKKSFYHSVQEGLKQTTTLLYLVSHFIKNAISHGIKENELAGPIKIAQIVGKATKQGFSVWLFTLAFISLQLAIFNLLPIPALDGGHLFILLIESIIRKDIPIQWKMKIQYIGFSLLLTFFIYIIFKDIQHLL